MVLDDVTMKAEVTEATGLFRMCLDESFLCIYGNISFKNKEHLLQVASPLAQANILECNKDQNKQSDVVFFALNM